jgi:hypothetical protein
MPASRSSTALHSMRRQRGAVLMVMLVILVIGAITIFVSALNSSALQNAHDKTTADALAQAREALVGRAVVDLTSPGSLPCPDNNDDGSAESPVGQPSGNCPSYIGRLPWKTLGLPDLRDGFGERLWYVLSPNFRDYVSLNPINSNNVGSLTVSGSTPASNVVAIVFAAGPVIGTQSRSHAKQVACSTQGGVSVFESLCATNYLEGANPAPNLQTTPNLNYQTANTSTTFNDRLMIIRAADIIPAVEKRVASDLTVAFSNYVSAHGAYPYPANFNACTSASCPADSTTPVCIGKIPATDLAAFLPTYFTPNNWFDVIYYTMGTNSLTTGGGAGTGPYGWWGGRRGWRDGWGGGWGGGWSGGGSPTGTGTGCYAPTLFTSGTSVNGLFLMPGPPLGNIVRSSPGLSSSNLVDYFEDSENQNLDDLYILPSANSNDTLIALP